MYSPPKTITEHPAVELCEKPFGGAEDEYRHDVVLKSGWYFAGIDHLDKTYGVSHFKTVKEFLDAKPTQFAT